MVDKSTFRRLALLGRIKSMRLKIAFHLGAKQVGILAFAMLLALGGLGFLMFSLFTALAAEIGIIAGALAAGLVLLALAGLAAICASRMKPGAEAQILDNLEASLIGDISRDVAELETGLKRIETGASALLQGDYLTALASIVSPKR